MPVAHRRGFETGNNARRMLGVRGNPSAAAPAAGVQSFRYEQFDRRVEQIC